MTECHPPLGLSATPEDTMDHLKASRRLKKKRIGYLDIVFIWCSVEAGQTRRTTTRPDTTREPCAARDAAAPSKTDLAAPSNQLIKVPTAEFVAATLHREDHVFGE